MVLGFFAYEVVCFLSRAWCRCLLEQAIGSLLLGWAGLVGWPVCPLGVGRGLVLCW